MATSEDTPKKGMNAPPKPMQGNPPPAQPDDAERDADVSTDAQIQPRIKPK